MNITWTALYNGSYYLKLKNVGGWWLISHLGQKRWRLFRNTWGYIGIFPTLRAAKHVVQTIIDAEKGNI